MAPKVIGYVVAGGLVLGLVVAIAWSYSLRSAVKSYGAPTPTDAKIQHDTDDLSVRIRAQADKDRQEVENASDADLYDLARERLRRK